MSTIVDQQMIEDLFWAFFIEVPDSQETWHFKKILPSFSAIEDLFALTSVKYAPGLLAILCSPKPPSIGSMKALHLPIKREEWGIYMIFFFKEKIATQAYIGPGTRITCSGVFICLQHYDSKTNGVIFDPVEKALNDGYVIVNKTLLCSLPTPPAE